jgi:Fic family protein
MARTFEGTHPWLTFGLDLTRFDHRMWMMLGEAASKCEHVAGVPLAPDVAEKMHQVYLAKGAAATTAIEGNTLSEKEAEAVISGALKLPPSQQYLANEINNIVEAFNEITTTISRDGAWKLDIDFLKRINRLVLKGLDVEPEVIPGEIRTHKVVVGRYRCAPPEDCDYLLERMCSMLNDFPIPDDQKHSYSLIKASLAHLYFVWIHPFGDGNGRTARLLELYILLSSGLAQPTGHLLSNHYNKTRQKYYESLERAVESPAKVIEFIRYSVIGFLEGLREQIASIREQQWQVAWVNYVHETFHDRNSPSDVRRRHIVLALSQAPQPVPMSKITTLTPEVAIAYSGKTPKTVVRDINALMEMGLVAKRRGQLRAKRELILAFLPWRNVESDSAKLPLAA